MSFFNRTPPPFVQFAIEPKLLANIVPVRTLNRIVLYQIRGSPLYLVADPGPYELFAQVWLSPDEATALARVCWLFGRDIDRGNRGLLGM